MEQLKIAVVLTQWKRNHLGKQLEQISRQNINIDYIIVFQNENHVDITNLKDIYKFIHVKSDYNTKYFGRFSYLFTIPADICVVMDDDIIPGVNCIKNYVEQCINKNSIIGGNGRIAFINKNKQKLRQINDVGIRQCTKYDFVGHMWCFKKDWLYYMFSVKPLTYETGEDMHLCFSSKLFGNIDSYIAEHKNIEECSDITMNRLAVDKFSSCNNKSITYELRQNIQEYWEKKGLKFIDSN